MLNKNRLVFTIFILFLSVLYLNAQSRRSADKFTFNNKTKVFQYTGNAKMEDSSAIITSHIMTFYQETELATFSGGVRLLSKTNGSTITGGYASYNGKTRYAYVKNNPVLRSPTNNMTIKSSFMERDFNTPIAKAISNVHLTHIDSESKRKTDGYADNLVYDMDKETAVLTGNPRLYQGADRLEGEILEYNAKTATANVMGRGKIYVLQTNNYINTSETNKKKSNVSNYNIIVADRLFLNEYGGKDNNTRTLYAYGNVTAFFYEENMILKGGYIEYEIDNEHVYMYEEPSVRIPDRGIIAFGEWIEYKKDAEFKDVIFHNDVVMVDYDANLSLEGDLLHLDPDTKVATVSGSPKAYVENRSIKITSVTMQMFNDEEKLRANGNVYVEGKDMNSQSAWATYFDKQKYLRLWGENPYLKQKESVVRAREIKYYINTQKVEAMGVSGEIPQ
nr:LptA/OstA family protein [Brachyspira innocens]